MSRSQVKVVVFGILLLVVFVGAMVSVSGAPLPDECPPSMGGYCWLLTQWATAGTLVYTPVPSNLQPIVVTVPIWSSPLTPVILAIVAALAIYRAFRKIFL